MTLSGSLALLLVLLACSEGGGGPLDPPGQEQRLAGGGRAQDDDPFAGGRDESGPAGPQIDPLPAYVPLFYAVTNCFAEPFQRVVRTATDWQAWWSTAVACLPHDERLTDPPPFLLSPGGDPGTGGGSNPDSGVVDPGEPGDPYGPDAPPVDFDTNVVVSIGLEEESAWGRGLWITDVVAGAGGSTIKFEVVSPGADCVVLGAPGDPGAPADNSPTIATLVPGSVTEPVTFERTDVTWDCSWEPDPDLPLTLYYTDAECDLGSGEALITESDAWESWLNEAGACDRSRWGGPGDSTIVSGGGEGEPSRPPEAPPGAGDDPTAPVPWLGLDVNFGTHAVLVLRADSQARWGGGVWPNEFAVSADGTTIDYSVMEPGEECPVVEGGGSVRPTAAIRLALPFQAPIRYARHVESIDCRWEPAPLPPARPS